MKPFSGVHENVRADRRCQDLRRARALDLTRTAIRLLAYPWLPFPWLPFVRARWFGERIVV